MQKKSLVRPQLRSNVRWGIVGIVALMVVSVCFDLPKYVNQGIDVVNNSVALGIPRIPEKPFSLGLDLQGGAHLVYKADIDKIGAADRGAAVEGVREVIERRVNGLGVSEAHVETANIGGDYRIIVELPGITNVMQAVQLIGETPTLEFKEINNEPPRQLTKEEQAEIVAYNATAKNRAQNILNDIQDGATFADKVNQYSEDELSKNNGGYLGYISATSSYPALYAWAKTAKEGQTVSKLVTSTDGYEIIKRGALRDGQKLVNASHILICYIGAPNCVDSTYTKEQAKQKAEEVYKEVNGKNFADLAKQFSSDPGTKDKGGDLGTFSQDRMVEPFGTAVFGAKVGEIIGPVETVFGYHVIYKRGEEFSKEYEIWRLLVRTKKAADIIPPQEAFVSTGLSGSQLKHAEIVTDQRSGAVQVSLQFNDEGAKLFRDITARNVGKQVAIYLDGQVISAPTVQQTIADGQAVISSQQFSLVEARLLSQRLNAGALPIPVELISQQSVEASLGVLSLQKSLTAGIIGTLIVMLFMIMYYRLPGLLSVIALALYIALTLAIFKLVGIALSLAGIAGVILSIGITGDANVLIFERMKEELRAGKTLRVAVEEGFTRAWPSIRDSNVCTLFSCVLLVWFGESFVKGFALTLAIGILVSLFSAITVTRVLLRFVTPWFAEKANRLFLGAQADTHESREF